MPSPYLIPGLLSAGVVALVAASRSPTPPPPPPPPPPAPNPAALLARFQAFLQRAQQNPQEVNPNDMDCLAFDLQQANLSAQAQQLHAAANAVRSARGMGPLPFPTVMCPPPTGGVMDPGMGTSQDLVAARQAATTALAQAAQVTAATVGMASADTPEQLRYAAQRLRDAYAAAGMAPGSSIDEPVASRLENEANRIAALLGAPQQPPKAPMGGVPVPPWCTNPGGMGVLPAAVAAQVQNLLTRVDTAAPAEADLLAAQLEACGGFTMQITQLRERAKFLRSLQTVTTGARYRPRRDMRFRRW